MPASFSLFFCPVSVSVVDVLVLYCVCRGGGSIPPVSFCAGALPRFVALVLDLKSGGIALTLLGAGHSPQTQKKNLPDAGHIIVERWLVSRPWWRFVSNKFVFFVNGAKYLAGKQPPGNAEFTS